MVYGAGGGFGRRRRGENRGGGGGPGGGGREAGGESAGLFQASRVHLKSFIQACVAHEGAGTSTGLFQASRVHLKSFIQACVAHEGAGTSTGLFQASRVLCSLLLLTTCFQITTLTQHSVGRLKHGVQGIGATEERVLGFVLQDEADPGLVPEKPAHVSEEESLYL